MILLPLNVIKYHASFVLTLVMEIANVRDLQEGDYVKWVRLLDLYNEYHNSSLEEKIKRHTFKRCVDPNVDMWSALAIHHETGKIVGFANYLKHMYTRGEKDKIYISDLYVDESQRSKGVGRSLIQHVYKKADEMGDVCDVYWFTDIENHTARALYTKVGYDSGKIVFKRPKNECAKEQ